MLWIVKLFARFLWHGTGALTESRLDDPIYKTNVRKLIERISRFEDTKQ
jgi:hypothetical protein